MVRQVLRQRGNVKQRSAGLYAIDVIRKRQLRRELFGWGLIIRKFRERGVGGNRLRAAKLLCLCQCREYCALITKIENFYEPIERRFLRYLTFNQGKFSPMFRFCRRDMVRLHHCLLLPEKFQLDNGMQINGQEGFLIFLAFAVYPQRLIDKEEMLGYEFTELGRIRSWILVFLYRVHQHRVTDYLHWHMKFIERSREATQLLKLKHSKQDPKSFPHRSRNVALNVDCWRLRTTRQKGRWEVSIIYICIILI